ncbi:tryptophanase [candidate division WOR-3 bacterium]|nr:tryptophanase [candidate division WOR-3 bacterium]
MCEPEPYRIKVVEPLPRTTRRTRLKVLEQAGYNPFLIPARYVTLDLISDSGTGAMTEQQWAAMVRAREDFAGPATFDEFVAQARSITGFPYVQPVHQGRSAENILFRILLKRGQTVFANTHFETTRGNIEALGCRAVDLPSHDPEPPFLGNIDLQRLEARVARQKRAGLIILTLTSNIKGGQPVSLENIARTRRIARRHKIPLVLDASRFADNAYLIKENSTSKQSVRSICRRMFRCADIIYLSSKKDGLVNIGGFIAIRDKRLYETLRSEIIRQEGYPTSGGLAARDVAAMTLGLSDALDEDFLRVHIDRIRSLARMLRQNGVEVFEPAGGHAAVIFPANDSRYAAFALSARIYLEAGIRTGVFEESVRIAVPRRVYTRDHLEYVADRIGRAYRRERQGKRLRLKLAYRPAEFFNFFARFRTG